MTAKYSFYVCFVGSSDINEVIPNSVLNGFLVHSWFVVLQSNSPLVVFDQH